MIDSPRPRVGICGMSIESSTFSPHRSGWDAFAVRRGAEMLDYYDFFAADGDLREAAEWVPLVHARSLPGGAVPAAVYEAVKAETIGLLAQVGPLDALVLDIHGAMTVVGRDDAESDLATAIRAAIGPDVLVSATMDLHGNVTRELAAAVDLITCYRMAPHEDYMETKERAVRNLLQRLGTKDAPGPGKPKKAWVQVPVLLPGEKTSTRLEPAHSIYAEVPVVESMPGVLDAAVWVGYAWADEPRCRAAVVVTGDDEQLIVAQARRLAQMYWDGRHQFSFVAPTGSLSECVDAALASEARPFFISDSGDNPTAGGAGDVTWTATQLLRDPRLTSPGSPSVIVASIPDPDAVAAAFAAGLEQSVRLSAGATVDAGPSGPVDIEGVVDQLTDGDRESGRVAVIRVGGLRLILTERRKPYHKESDFQAAGLDARSADIVVVKIGYLEPELFDMAADWLLALTPGGVDQDLLRLGHHRITRPLFPFDSEMADPDLSPEIL